MDAVTTHWEGVTRNESYSALHQQFYAEGVSRRKVMRISHDQMEKLTVIFEQRYIDGLVGMIDEWSKGEEQFSTHVIANTFRWLKVQGITDDRSIRGLFRLFHERGCLALKQMPASFITALAMEGESGVYKAEMLLLQELGNVPL